MIMLRKNLIMSLLALTFACGEKESVSSRSSGSGVQDLRTGKPSSPGSDDVIGQGARESLDRDGAMNDVNVSDSLQSKASLPPDSGLDSKDKPQGLDAEEIQRKVSAIKQSMNPQKNDGKSKDDATKTITKIEKNVVSEEFSQVEESETRIETDIDIKITNKDKPADAEDNAPNPNEPVDEEPVVQQAGPCKWFNMLDPAYDTIEGFPESIKLKLVDYVGKDSTVVSEDKKNFSTIVRVFHDKESLEKSKHVTLDEKKKLFHTDYLISVTNADNDKCEASALKF